MNGQAFLGCRINLISRAGIRYEGILYTIDANNSTVALSKVKSFGTEDRYAETPVLPRDEIYEYIIFRGSDIQDLHVCEAPKKQPQIMAQDPAILEITGKPPISAPFSRRRVQFTSRSYQGNDQEIPYIDDMRYGSYYQGYNDDDINETWPERVTSRSYYSRSRSYYPNGNNQMRNPPIFYPEMPRYNTYRRRSGFSAPDGNIKVSSGPDQPLRKNATLRRNTRRSSSLNIKSAGQRSMIENGQEISRTSSGNSRSTNMSGRPESQNSPEYKYDKEYDFESANAEIAKELERLTLEKHSVSTTTLPGCEHSTCEPTDKGPTGDGERPEHDEINSVTQINGDSVGYIESDRLLSCITMMPLSVNTEMLSNGYVTKDDGDNVVNYDRSKSFYDNISSEATDRAKGKMIRAINWRDERKLNVETFGFNISGNNRQSLRRNAADSGNNTINASNSASNRMNNMNMQNSSSSSSSFYKQDVMRYHQAPPPMGSYYPQYYQPYYQPRWFSSRRQPDYRQSSYVQGWN